MCGNCGLLAHIRLERSYYAATIPSMSVPGFNVFNDTYEKVERFYENLNHEDYHFINSNDESTPIGCVKEMVDSIPGSFWKRKDIKVLDPCAGNGNFHAYLLRKTAFENLYFNEINEMRVENIKRIFGPGAKVSLEDFLTFEEKEQFDLIVSNPPYAKFNGSNRTAKNHNLSRDFILKAIKITKPGGYILFIVPDNWMSLADRNDVVRTLSQYQFRHLNIHRAKRWFPKVGSSFSWFLLQKIPNKESFVVENGYKIKTVTRAQLYPGTDYIPLYFNNEVRSIIEKTLDSDNKKYNIETSSDLHKFTRRDLLSEKKDAAHPFKIIHTPTQTVWAKRPHKFQNGYKVFISLTNQYSTFVEKDAGATQSIAFVRCKNKKEAERIKSELDNGLYIFLNNITRYGNFNNIRVLQRFPVLTDFRLTEREQECISEFNEHYARRYTKQQRLSLGAEKR